MSPILFQGGFIFLYILVVIAVRAMVGAYFRQRDEEAREREAALWREWKVGIPYDPDPIESDRKGRR